MLHLANGHPDKPVSDRDYHKVVLSVEKLCASIIALGVRPPSFPPIQKRSFFDTVLRDWWEKQAPGLTNEQKAAIWRLIDPYPFEIIEIPFEE